MEKLIQFVSEHLSDDLSRLVMSRNKWPEIDINMAVACIESRRKLKGKVQEWYDMPELIFPLKLSAEQCSSSATGLYKSRLAAEIARGSESQESSDAPWRLTDLTGGLGIDSWFFSKKAEAVLYNEMQEALCKAAEHNFKALGADNISISNKAICNVTSGENEISPKDLLSEFRPDIIYMDPARRGEGGKKVFLIEECTPDVLTLKEELMSICRHLLIKLSPMADITMVCNRLGSGCREVHIVTSEGECKELLIWMDREWKEAYSITAVEIHAGYPEVAETRFTFCPEEEKDTVAQIATEMKGYLFEPGKSLTKAGAFNMIGVRFGAGKLGRSTHLYVTDDEDKAMSLKKYGKVFRILDCNPLDKRSMKQAGQDHPKAEVTARNIPLTSDALRKKIGCASGGEVHIFGLKSDISGSLLFVCKRI